MRVIPLAPQDAMFGPATHKVILTFADLTAAGLTQTIQLLPVNMAGVGAGTLPAGTIVRLVGMKLPTSFTSSGAMSSLVFTVGDAGSNNRFLTSTQILSGATPVGNKISSAAGDAFTYDAATALSAFFTAVGANLNTANGGNLEIYLRIESQANRAL